MPRARDLRSPYLGVCLEQVCLRLGGRSILRSIDWEIRPGERWALLGENGAGKTLLLKLLAGDIWPTPGPRSARWYLWRGRRHSEPYGLKEQIAYVGAERQDRYEHYEWNLRADAIVGTGLHHTDIPLQPLRAAERRRIEHLADRLRIRELLRRRFLTLSYGQRRLVLLARALAWAPALLLLDELLNGLDADYRVRVLGLIAGLSRRRLPWVFAAHRPEDIPPSCTHLCVLAGGRVRWQGPISAAPAAVLPRPPDVAPAALRRARGAAAAHAAVQVGLRNAWVWLDGRAVLRRLNFQIRRGECWVIHGANGSGKSTLLRAIYGDLGVSDRGELRRRGIAPGVAIDEFKRRVGFVAPELQSAHPLYLTAEAVVVSGLRASIGLDASATAAERSLAARALRRFGATALVRRTLRALSYGQLRRVLCARAWVREPDILLLDEPYTGLDAATRRAVRRQIERALSGGATLVMATHHRDEWPAPATHELELGAGAALYCGVLRQGRGR